ncbi:MAG: hypothetical protein Q8934_07130 [Bacillota bacterium]|nr:hypothetical protein [Bacillota bacterium]
MKKLFFSIIIGIILLAACQQEKPKTASPNKPVIVKQKAIQKLNSNTSFPYPNLLATNGDSYSLLAVGEINEKSPIEKNKIVIKRVKDILSLPLDQAKKIYPNLNIEHNPEYVLFDQNGIVYQTTTLKTLTQFLENKKSK